MSKLTDLEERIKRLEETVDLLSKQGFPSKVEHYHYDCSDDEIDWVKMNSTTMGTN